MGAPNQQPPFPRDAWPFFELKRYPNGEIGLAMELPCPPEVRKATGIDVLAWLIEPQRAKTMHANLADMLDALGLVATKLHGYRTRERQLAMRAIGFSTHGDGCAGVRFDKPDECTCGLASLRKEIEALP